MVHFGQMVLSNPSGSLDAYVAIVIIGSLGTIGTRVFFDSLGKHVTIMMFDSLNAYETIRSSWFTHIV